MIDLSLHRLVEFAIYAPSGENAQPWKFVSHGKDQIDVYVETSRDNSPYSWGHRAAYVAIGAAIENMLIGASSLGKGIEVSFFPDKNNSEHVAHLYVTDIEAKIDPLVEVVPLRSTNRKPYKKYTLSEEEMEALKLSVAGPEYALFSLTTDPASVKAIADAGSTNERIMLGNEKLHDYFFSHVNWTEHDDILKKEGFFVRTLELPPPAVLGFKVMSSWSRAEILNSYLKFNQVVQTQNSKIYQSSSGMGVVYANEDSPMNAVKAGMTLQRVWLEVCKRGLALQPLSGIPYLKLGIDNNHSTDFDDNEKQLVQKAYSSMGNAFGLSGKTIYFAFRLGKADPPTARARRYTVEDVMEENA